MVLVYYFFVCLLHVVRIHYFIERLREKNPKFYQKDQLFFGYLYEPLLCIESTEILAYSV